MRNQYPKAEIVQDIGSGLNYKCKGLKSLLGRCLRGEKLSIVVAHQDRLARFGFELIEWIVGEIGSELVVLSDSKGEPEQELTKDLLTIIHVFSCRLLRLRHYKSKKDTNEANQTARKIVECVDEHLPLHLQRNNLDSKR
jgi:predicted site-specific integrase-resolvase